MSDQERARWVRCSEHPKGDWVYVNLAQVSYMKRHNDQSTALYFQKVHTLSVKESPEAILAKKPADVD
jgi:hypothetical protein